MLIEIWERLRGVDQWPEVKAVVTDKSTRWLTTKAAQASAILSSIEFEYRSSDGLLRSNSTRVFGRLSYLDVGDEFYVRCCAEDPTKIYLRDSARSKFQLAAAAAIFFILFWLRARYRW